MGVCNERRMDIERMIIVGVVKQKVSVDWRKMFGSYSVAERLNSRKKMGSLRVASGRRSRSTLDTSGTSTPEWLWLLLAGHAPALPLYAGSLYRRSVTVSHRGFDPGTAILPTLGTDGVWKQNQIKASRLRITSYNINFVSVCSLLFSTSSCAYCCLLTVESHNDSRSL